MARCTTTPDFSGLWIDEAAGVLHVRSVSGNMPSALRSTPFPLTMDVVSGRLSYTETRVLLCTLFESRFSDVVSSAGYDPVSDTLQIDVVSPAAAAPSPDDVAAVLGLDASLVIVNPDRPVPVAEVGMPSTSL